MGEWCYKGACEKREASALQGGVRGSTQPALRPARLHRPPTPAPAWRCPASPDSVSTVKGISVSSTRQLTVGMMKELVRCGTPWNPSSRNGTSNSRFRSLVRGDVVQAQGWGEGGSGSGSQGRAMALAVHTAP